MVRYRVVEVLAALVLMGSAAYAEAPVRAAAGDHGGAKAAPRAQPSSVKPRSTPAPKVVTPAAKVVTPAPKVVTPAANVVAPKLAPGAKLAAPNTAAKGPATLSAPVSPDVVETDDDDAAPQPAPVTIVEGKPMTSAQLIVEYQRIGRDLHKLQELRGTDCTLDLWPRFRAIKLDEACKTPESRLDLESELKDLRAKIDRRRGIELSTECLNNPLAANCQ